MILLSLLVLSVGGSGASSDVPNAPSVVTVVTSRGERAIAIRMTRGHPVLSVDELGVLLPVSAEFEVEWARVDFAGQSFRFLLGAPLFEFRNRVVPVVGGAYVVRDSLYVPLQWLVTYIPELFSEAYRYDPLSARFEEMGMTPVASRLSQQPSAPLNERNEPSVDPDTPAAARKLGLRRSHLVVIDAGHGGRDPGTRGGGLTEKHLVLSIATRLQQELESMGVDVYMTRTRDVLIPLSERAPTCQEGCDLFVSIHVNALNVSPGYQNVAGLETFFFDHRRTEAPDRLELLENASLRYETDLEPAASNSNPLRAILQDLEENEYLRESAQLADLIDQSAAAVHPNGSRRVGQMNLEVLRLATRPAVLVEAGFSTNREDADFMRSSTGRGRLARAIAEGVVQYLLRYETIVNP